MKAGIYSKRNKEQRQEWRYAGEALPFWKRFVTCGCDPGCPTVDTPVEQVRLVFARVS